MHLFAKRQEILFVQCFHYSYLFRCCFICTMLFKFWVLLHFSPPVILLLVLIWQIVQQASWKLKLISNLVVICHVHIILRQSLLALAHASLTVSHADAKIKLQKTVYIQLIGHIMRLLTSNTNIKITTSGVCVSVTTELRSASTL